MNIKPLSNYVLVTPLKVKESVFVVEEKERGYGEVIAVGPLCGLKVGSRVYFSLYGTEKTEEGHFIREDEVLAVEA